MAPSVPTHHMEEVAEHWASWATSHFATEVLAWELEEGHAPTGAPWNMELEQLPLNFLDAQRELAIAADPAQTLFQTDRQGTFVVASSSSFDLQDCSSLEVGLLAYHQLITL